MWGSTEHVEEGMELVRTELENYQCARKLLGDPIQDWASDIVLQIDSIRPIFSQVVSEYQRGHNKTAVLKF